MSRDVRPGRGIAQFMWAFQHHFRYGLEHAAADVFNQIGFGLGPRGYLIGFTDDPGKHFAVCVEPETEAIASIDLSNVATRGAKKYRSNPEANTIITSDRHHERFHRALRGTMRADALRATLQADATYSDRYFFVGSSATVNGYEVHPVISVPRARWDAKPTLHTDVIDRIPVVRSFQHALMRELLNTATHDLSSAEPPEQFSLQWSDRSELIRTAAAVFVQSASVRSGYPYQSELRVALDEVSAQPYEGRPGSGGFLLAAADNPHVRPALTFTAPIRLSETRSVRKALEMTSKRLHLWCEGAKLIGLAELEPTYDPAEQNAYLLTVVGRSSWELTHADTALLRVTNTRPALPEPRLPPGDFTSTATRVFPEATRDDVDRLWQLTLAAADASHGTMLVVHRDAAGQAARLAPQAQQVAPQELDLDVLKSVTNIDGAVLVDFQGQCHAIGAILDGHATGHGDPSRGARYNSAVRYQAAQGNECLVIIVSEDGMVNLLPNLPRVVTRDAIEAVVRQVEETVSKDPDRGTHLEEFSRAWTHLEAVSFYLTADQCTRVNQAREHLETDRTRLGVTLTGWRRMEPNPDLNETYFT